MAKNKYYVVWKGITPGVYDNWGECKAQVDGQDGAKYKSFETKEEATKAFEKGYEHYLKTASSSKAAAGLTPKTPVGKPIGKAFVWMLLVAGIRETWNTEASIRRPCKRSSGSGR